MTGMSMVTGMKHHIRNLTSLLLVTATVNACPDIFLDAVATVESSNKPYAIGDHGKACGLFQMHKDAWEQVSHSRSQKGLEVWSYASAFDPKVSRIYASDYLDWMTNSIRSKTGANPSAAQVYAGYNQGLSGLAHCRYDVNLTPNHTVLACNKIDRLTQGLILKP